MYMCVCVSYVCASIAHTRMCRIITGQKESLEKVPPEMTELWSKAVRTNARAVKNGTFQQMARSWPELEQVSYLHGTFCEYHAKLLNAKGYPAQLCACAET